MVIGMAFLWFFARKWLDKPLAKEVGKVTFDGEVLLKDYNALQYIHTVQVPQQHAVIGQTLKELKWPNQFKVTVLEVIRKDNSGLVKMLLRSIYG